MGNNIEDNFAKYDQALGLKDLGYDEPYIAVYGKDTSHLYIIRESDKFDSIDEMFFIKAPLKQQVFKWFREKYGMHHSIAFDVDTNTFDAIIFGEIVPPFMEEEKMFYTYEEAENACIDKLIEIAKQQAIT